MEKQSKNNGCYNNLISQVNSLFDSTRHTVGIKSRYKYLENEKAFCSFLADKYHLQKLANVKSSHIISYTEHLKSSGYSSSSIKTSLSAIRYFHNLTGSKNQLIGNDKLNIEPRAYKAIDRSWSNTEAHRCLSILKENNLKMYHIFNLAYHNGYRLEEVVRTKPAYLLEAINTTGQVWCKGKNGKVRYITIRTPEQEASIKEALQYAQELGKGNNDFIFCDNIKGSTAKCKRSVQNYLTANQHKWIEPDRVLIRDTAKIKSSTLCFHGIRYLYCNNLYNEILKETGDKRYSRLYCSQQLGHQREYCVTTYLK